MVARVIRRIIYSLLLLILLMLLIGATLYLHSPSWYRPLRLEEGQLRQVYQDLDRQLSTLENQAAFNPPDRPIEMEFTQQQVNELIQVLPMYYPKAKLPADLVDPVIAFRKDRLILAARFPKLSKRPIGLVLALRVEPEQVRLAIDAVQAGSLPLPRQLIDDQLAELRYRLGQLAERLEAERKKDKNSADVLEAGRMLFRAIDGQPIQRQFKDRNSGRLVQVEKVELEPGLLRLTLQPLGPAVQRRRDWDERPMWPGDLDKLWPKTQPAAAAPPPPPTAESDSSATQVE